MDWHLIVFEIVLGGVVPMEKFGTYQSVADCFYANMILIDVMREANLLSDYFSMCVKG